MLDILGLQACLLVPHVSQEPMLPPLGCLVAHRAALEPLLPHLGYLLAHHVLLENTPILRQFNALIAAKELTRLPSVLQVLQHVSCVKLANTQPSLVPQVTQPV